VKWLLIAPAGLAALAYLVVRGGTKTLVNLDDTRPDAAEAERARLPHALPHIAHIPTQRGAYLRISPDMLDRLDEHLTAFLSGCADLPCSLHDPLECVHNRCCPGCFVNPEPENGDKP
jgi:hypothetical protein